MAMMNCAANLVEQGKKVLVVDFDLEAPGLDTFNLDWGKRATRKGLVDYVVNYLRTDVAPKLDEYVYKGSFKTDSKGELWLMPAGRRGVNYHHRLNSINWRYLYEYKDGYLLFENLKAQWKKSLNPDYVLVDSRTGHTDVSGICTRQIPDAIVLLFFPNKQNLSGLVPIVERVRNENKNGGRELRMHFVTSNVPDIDDEHSILWKRLEEFQTRLNYTKLAAKIHHYQSLSLLNQEIFTASRPNSRLASEYSELVSEIQKFNWRDRTGAISYLEEVVRGKIDSHKQSYKYLDKLDEIVENILNHHIDDFETVKLVVRYFKERQDEEQARQILLQVWNRFKYVPSYLVMYAQFEAQVSHLKEAVKLAIAATNYKGLSLSELRVIVRLLLKTPNEDLEASKTLYSIESWKSVLELDEYELVKLAMLLSFQQYTLKAAEQLLRRSIHRSKSQSDNIDESCLRLGQHRLVISLISQRKFDKAIEYCEELRASSHHKWGTPDMFHLAMAKWGKTQQIPIEDFRSVADRIRFDEYDDASFKQCMSLVYWALREKEIAQEFLDKAKKKSRLIQYSCWSYLCSRSSEFHKDLDEQQSLLDGKDILPRIIAPV